MGFKIAIGLSLVVVAFLIYVAFLPANYRVERQAHIDAPSAKVFPHVSDVRAADAWNPFTKDPKIEKEFSPQTNEVGAFLVWRAKGNSGRATVTESRPNKVVVTRLDFVEPFVGTSVATVRLEDDGSGTLVRWSNEGESSFIPRALCTLRIFNMDKMIGGSFEKGLAELKTIVEAEAK